jgi:transcriptional antiterminator RfaH
MPLLVAEPNLFPLDLFDDEQPPAHETRRWRVLHTLPRQEKSLARILHETEIPYYLPLRERRWQSRGRPLTSHLPLFPGYVFLLADAEDRLKALKTKRVLHVLEVADQQGLWRDIRQVYRLIASGAPVMPEDRLVPGALVEIRSGPLQGLKGRIVRTASGRRFVVQVDFIQRGASVLLNDFALAALDS